MPNVDGNCDQLGVGAENGHNKSILRGVHFLSVYYFCGNRRDWPDSFVEIQQL